MKRGNMAFITSAVKRRDEKSLVVGAAKPG